MTPTDHMRSIRRPATFARPPADPHRVHPAGPECALLERRVRHDASVWRPLAHGPATV